MRFWSWFAFVLALADTNGAIADEAVPAPRNERFNWGLGGYVGIFSGSSPGELVIDPANPDIESNYIMALTATASLLHFDSLPLTLEFEGIVAKRFGDDSFFEFGALPIVRWHSFPWNDSVYTTVRFGPIGLSYTTGISQYEQPTEGPDEHLVNLLVFEVTLADPADKSLEGFARLHHRSDAFGLMGDIPVGGDDFLSLGLRKRF